MNYTPAKKLKDAGFPVREAYCDCNVLRSSANQRKHIEIDHYSEWAPTLEELIEACGNDLQQLVQYEDSRISDPNHKWCAWPRPKHSEHYPEGSYGPEPRIAVARLWLTLQKHNNTNEVKKCESCLAGFSKDDVLGNCTCL